MLWAQVEAAVVQTQSITPPMPMAPVMLRLPPWRALNRFAAAFAGANADAIIQWQHKDFSVADFARRARAAPFDDGVNRGLDKILVHGNLQLYFAEQVHANLVTTVQLRMTF